MDKAISMKKKKEWAAWRLYDAKVKNQNEDAQQEDLETIQEGVEDPTKINHTTQADR